MTRGNIYRQSCKWCGEPARYELQGNYVDVPICEACLKVYFTDDVHVSPIPEPTGGATP